VILEPFVIADDEIPSAIRHAIRRTTAVPDMHVAASHYQLSSVTSLDRYAFEQSL
jgi:hypothetical protein